jgi:hypothetical protein
MSMDITIARRTIAEEIGPDVGSFTPPDEKRFFGAAVMLTLGGAFLYAFFKALAEKLGEKAGEKAGEEMWKFVETEIGAARNADEEGQDRLLRGAANTAGQAIKTSKLDADSIAAVAALVESDLTLALAQQAPDDTSARVATRVRLVALEVLSAPK